ncbi:furin-1-like [Mytilus galloprovincialis]|uniref:furin-1-like n=1 Tax=Mytilus galloprovincialis TaxID=29158 RepID=UPI003F7BF74F
MKVSNAWSAGYTGAGIVIAVLDDGLQTDHPDLAANVDTANDKDIYGYDNDPYSSAGNSHGTEVSGLIAAVKDNNICVVGVAFSSTIIGIRILGKYPITDSEEAQGLSHYLSNVDIYSNSWGATDGTGFTGPGSVTKAALLDGVTNGRNGKGAIYIWAAGNGQTNDNCNGDGYVNSIYTVAISSAQIGQNAWYSEVCAPALAVAYGGSEDDRYLTTTTIGSECKSAIQGTSYSAPLVSGIVALTLEANSDLTWRDIQHLIVFTSSRSGLSDTYSNWTMNGANKEFSQILGFGLMDADAMVSYGKIWVTVPTQQTCNTSTRSPSLYQDAVDNQAEGSQTWDFMSVHFWKENPIGSWTLEISSEWPEVTVTLDSWSLTFHGTTTDPWSAQGSNVVTAEPTTDNVTQPKKTTDTITKATTPADAPTTKTTTYDVTPPKMTNDTKTTKSTTPVDLQTTKTTTVTVPTTKTTSQNNVETTAQGSNVETADPTTYDVTPPKMTNDTKTTKSTTPVDLQTTKTTTVTVPTTKTTTVTVPTTKTTTVTVPTTKTTSQNNVETTAQGSNVETADPTTYDVTPPKMTNDTKTTKSTTPVDLQTTKTTTVTVPTTKTTTVTVPTTKTTTVTVPTTKTTSQNNVETTVNNDSAVIAGTVTSAVIVLVVVAFFVIL